MKKLSKIQLKNVNGGSFACYCNNEFRGYANTGAGCLYICDKKVIQPAEGAV